jgi:hypothetical protein
MQPLTIIPERGETIFAMFNPERYTVSKSLQLAEIGIPGLDSPVVQYVRGQNEKISMELFFDTTDDGMVGDVTDVRDRTSKVYALMKVDGELHAPPRVLLDWGTGGQLTSHGTSIEPWLILESISEEFNLFSPDGIPLRARLTVTFREAWTIEEQLQVTPRHSSDRTKLRPVQRGETLSRIAFDEYQDPTAWRAIADANDLENPRLLQPGTVLAIPPVTGTAAGLVTTSGTR